MAAEKKKPEKKKSDFSGIERSLRDDAGKELAHSHKPSHDLKLWRQNKVVF
jgi:hypothetical protein